MQILHPAQPEIVYPTGDGQPVAESYVHFWAITTIALLLRQYIEDQPTPDPKPRYQATPGTVLANQFLYFAQGLPRLRVAPDVMVIFDVAPGGRDNYKIWEEPQAPAVIFEITSAGTRDQDQNYKKELYEQLGVREYWLFDPKGEWIPEQLRGYRLVEERYQPIEDQISKQLALKLEVAGSLLDFYRLSDGEKLPQPRELVTQIAQERQRADLERQRADEQQQQADQERQRADRLAQRLRDLGLEPDEI